MLFVDYDDHSGGIFGELFGAEPAARWVELRTAGRMEEARAYLHSLWAGIEGDPWTHIEAAGAPRSTSSCSPRCRTRPT